MHSITFGSTVVFLVMVLSFVPGIRAQMVSTSNSATVSQLMATQAGQAAVIASNAEKIGGVQKDIEILRNKQEEQAEQLAMIRGATLLFGPLISIGQILLAVMQFRLNKAGQAGGYDRRTGSERRSPDDKRVS